MTPEEYISKQAPERQKLLSGIHAAILKADKKAVAEVGKMMGAPMIIYKTGGFFKYGLAGMKDYMSLHAMPIYGSPELHAKHKALISTANFQKGCVNFKDDKEMPLKMAQNLIADCAKVDMVALMEKYKKGKKKKA